MKPLHSLLVMAMLAGCGSGRQLVAEGRLPGGEAYRDYSTQPFGFRIERETYGPDGGLREVHNLLTEDNFKNLRAGMTPDQVVSLVGPSPASEQRVYGGGTKSWSYRYRDVAVIKLLHVVFAEDDRLKYWYTEWDPRVYSKDDRGRDNRGK